MLQERKQCSKLNQKSTGGAPLKGDIRPASSFSSPGDFDLSDWAYLAEGGAHVVFRYTGAAADLAGNVLKVRRDKHHPISWRLLVHFTAHVNELCRGSRDLHNVERTGGWESRQATPTAHGVERLKDISGRRARGGDNFPHRKEDHQRGEAEEDNNSAKDMEEQELPCKYAARAELGGAHKASDPTHEGATSCTSSCVSDKTVSSCSRPACGCSYCPACRLFFSSSGPRTRHRRLYGLISPMYLSCQRVILLPADVVDALLKLSRREAKKKREQGVCRESSTENRGLHSPPADDLPLDHDAEKKGVVQASVYTPHRSHRLGPPLQSAEGSESRLSCASSISSFSCSKSVGDDQAKGTSSGPSEPTDACPQGSLFSSTGTGVFSEGSVPCVLEEDFLSMPPAFSAVAIEKEVSRACSLRGAENPSIEAPQLPRENSEEDRTRLGCEVCRRLSGNIGIGTQSSARSTVSQLPSCDYYSVELKPKCGILEETQSTDDNESDSEAWQAGMKESGGPESSSLKRHLETRSREFATGRSPSRAADEAEGGALTEATAKLHKRERDVEEAMDVQLTEDFRVRGEGRESRSSGCLDEVRSTPPSLGGRKTERRKSRGSSQPKTSVHVSPIEGHHKFKIGKSLPSRFTMQQFAKLSMHKVSRLSLYDPTQFFQCTYAALSCQLRHLVENPQNNLSVFLNGSALPCQSLLRPLPRGASQEGTCGKAPPEEEDVGEPREPVLLVDILARVWEASRDLFEGILLLQAFAASQQRVAVRLARELRKVTGAQHDSLRRKHLAELEAYSKAVSEGLCGVFWPGVQESGDDLTRSNRAVSSGAAAGAKTCWSGTEDPAGLKATTGDDVAKSLQVYHGILGRRLVLQLRRLARAIDSRQGGQIRDIVEPVTEAAFAWICRYLLGRAFMDVSVMTNVVIVHQDASSEGEAFGNSSHLALSLTRFRRLRRECKATGSEVVSEKGKTRVGSVTSRQLRQRSAPGVSKAIFYRLSLVDIDFKSDDRIEKWLRDFEDIKKAYREAAVRRDVV